jgi:hypothetical protein
MRTGERSTGEREWGLFCALPASHRGSVTAWMRGRVEAPTTVSESQRRHLKEDQHSPITELDFP